MDLLLYKSEFCHEEAILISSAAQKPTSMAASVAEPTKECSPS